jgi:hypothetical protein
LTAHQPLAQAIWAYTPARCLWQGAQKVVSPSVTLGVPCGTAQGTYFLFHEVDSNDEFVELNENDNVVRLPLKVKVNNCGC